MSIHRFYFTTASKPRALPSLGTSLDAEAMRWGPSPREAMHAAHRARQARMRPVPLPPPPPRKWDDLIPSSITLIRKIQREVADAFGVSVADLISQRRTTGSRCSGGPDILTPRFVAIFLARKMTPRSFPEIGRMFGGRDHATIIHAIRVMVDRLANNPSLAARVDLIRARVKEGT